MAELSGGLGGNGPSGGAHPEEAIVLPSPPWRARLRLVRMLLCGRVPYYRLTLSNVTEVVPRQRYTAIVAVHLVLGWNETLERDVALGYGLLHLVHDPNAGS